MESFLFIKVSDNIQFNPPIFIFNWFPTDNESHVQLTEANVTFALTEIMPLTLSTPNVEYDFIKLEKNPITDNLVLLNTSNVQEANIQIVDITGKVVYQNAKQILNDRTSIPLNLASGLYILNVESNKMLLKIKLVVK